MSNPRPLSTRRQRAFTVVELLVVIAIIGALVALLLPAIQSAREVARIVQCKNNLRQVGLAMLHHETVRGTFPAGGWSSSWIGDPNMGAGSRQPGGWIYQSLPYMERQSIANLGLGLTREALKAALSEQGQAVIPMFFCPSRRPAQLYGVVEMRPMNYNELQFGAKTDYAANGGSYLNVWGKQYGPRAQFVFVTSDCLRGYPNCDWANKEFWINSVWNGIVGDHVGARMAQITDGASKTFLVGEKWLYELYYETVSVDDPFDNATNLIAADNPGDNGPMFIGYDYDTVRACNGTIDSSGSRVGYLPRRDSEYNIYNPQVDKKGAHYKESFGGPHAAGVNLVKCDGSVASWRFDIDPLVWASLGARNDGVP